VPLKKYHQKRDIKVTKEPGYQKKPRAVAKKSKKIKEGKKDPIYVIQKHAARHLHYDLRLEMNRALKSWALPKGPSRDPSVKRLAVHVEDHPLGYASFSGTIPKGHYGAGKVEIWDEGTWGNVGSLTKRQAYLKGDMTIHIQGKKLKGIFKLIRMKSNEKNGDNWLFFKVDDKTHTKAKVIKLERRATQSTLKKKEKNNRETTAKFALEIRRLANVRKRPQPKTYNPELGKRILKPPEGDEWLHEIKFDGYRMIGILKPNQIDLLTRHGHNWAKHFPFLVKQLRTLPLKNAIVDGELVALDKRGVSRFQMLQNAIDSKDTHNLRYFLFDIPYCNGFELNNTPLIQRKEWLKKVFQNWHEPHPNILYADHIIGEGKAVFDQACHFALEGILSKKIDSPYKQKRSHDWLKIKCQNRQEFVIGGFTKPKGSRRYFGSLLVGVYNDQNQFIFCGHVGTGFREESLEKLYSSLKKWVRKKPYFHDVSLIDKQKETTWVLPKLVCELEFLEWTNEGILRHPVFLGLRKDKETREVIRETSKKNMTKVTRSKAKLEKSENIGGVEITHGDRIFYPTKNITKRELAIYYDKVSSFMLPHIQNRPLLVLRCPSGSGKAFYQKHYNQAFPSPISSISLGRNSDHANLLMVKDKKGLMSLIQFDTIEIHPWGSNSKALEKPDRIVLDLDPGEQVSWQKVRRGALYLRDLLKKVGLKSYVKTTGGKGLHLVIPIQPKHSWSDIKTFTHSLASVASQKYPDYFTDVISKSKRKGKIFVDYLRNSMGSTAVAAFSVRARENGPISVPLSWEELMKTRSGDQYTVSNIEARISKLKKDPWPGFFSCRQTLPR